MNPLLLLLKGAAMGAANVIPGVSGGTIAFVTGIYDKLIDSMKSLDHRAAGDLLKFRFKDFFERTQMPFLLPLGIGVVLGIGVLAKLLEALFEKNETLVWAFFFGLIVASVWLVGKTVKPWNGKAITSFVAGLGVAVAVAILLKPAQENASFLYLVLCGAIAFCSMIVPGLSGSFVLVLLGNYKLVLGAISKFIDALKAFDIPVLIDISLKVILPVGIGVVFGFIVFSRVVSWLFTYQRNATVALLTGFIAGSLLIIWPWKRELPLLGENGAPQLRDGEPILGGYEWLMPSGDSTTWIALGLAVAGAALVVLIERFGSGRKTTEAASLKVD